MVKVEDVCPECEEVTKQSAEYIYWDGSGFTECSQCGKSIIRCGGYFPASRTPTREQRSIGDLQT